MNKTEIIKNINSILIEMGLPAVEEHYYTANLSDFLLMDSLALTEFILMIEKRFCVFIPNEKAEVITSFDDMVNCIVELKGI